MAKSVASLMGGPSPRVNRHLEKFMEATKEFYKRENNVAEMQERIQYMASIEDYADMLESLYGDEKPKETPPEEVKLITGKIKKVPDPDVTWGFSTIGDSLYD